jgi:hypothetical protein
VRGHRPARDDPVRPALDFEPTAYSETCEVVNPDKACRRSPCVHARARLPNGARKGPSCAGRTDPAPRSRAFVCRSTTARQRQQVLPGSMVSGNAQDSVAHRVFARFSHSRGRSGHAPSCPSDHECGARPQPDAPPAVRHHQDAPPDSRSRCRARLPTHRLVASAAGADTSCARLRGPNRR